MSDQEIQQAVCELLGVAFEQGRPVDPSFCREVHPGWDSLKHVEVLFALEDRFHVCFSEADMPLLVSVGKITERVKQLL